MLGGGPKWSPVGMESEVYKLRRDIGRCRYVLRNVSDPPARGVLEDMIAEAEMRLTLLYDRRLGAAENAAQNWNSDGPS